MGKSRLPPLLLLEALELKGCSYHLLKDAPYNSMARGESKGLENTPGSSYSKTQSTERSNRVRLPLGKDKESTRLRNREGAPSFCLFSGRPKKQRRGRGLTGRNPTRVLQEGNTNTGQATSGWVGTIDRNGTQCVPRKPNETWVGWECLIYIRVWEGIIVETRRVGGEF